MLRLLTVTALAGLLAALAIADPGPPSFPPAEFAPVDPDLARLGQLLFYDPILSGNRNISCATCHHPSLATADGVSVSLGEGGVGLGPDRRPDPANPPEQRIPRNAPALFNLGAAEFAVMFHDGRVEEDPGRPSGYRSPLEEALPEGLGSALAAQAMFPVTSPDEMAGQYDENEISKAVRLGLIAGPGGAWDLLAQRVAAIPAYADAFAAAIPDSAARPLHFADIAEALAAFMAFEWRADDSPFDRALRGGAPLAPEAADGMALFYGDAGCADCHSGRFQTDHGFHAMAAPQIGPGKAARYETHARDLGRMRVTGRAEDAYAFRTPSLRNVALTGPWGHAGAHSDLRAFLAHHADPSRPYDRTSAILPPLEGAEPFRILDDADEQAAVLAAAAPGRPLTDPQLDALLAFLDSLTDRAGVDGRLGIPETVPSGLPVER